MQNILEYARKNNKIKQKEENIKNSSFFCRNLSFIIKKAKYVTSLTNKEGGVGQFIIDFLNKKIH